MMDIHGRVCMRRLAALVPLANNELTGSRPGGGRTDIAVLVLLAKNGLSGPWGHRNRGRSCIEGPLLPADGQP